ncbi:MAG: transcriptional regulator [Eubacterium sp.]|nr:transcriptional regulator [Eubacterium sp.]
MTGLSVALLILLALLILQSIGGYLQIQNYRKAVRRMHKLGNVGLGQKRGRFLNGHVAIIACDNDGIITGAEVMDGIGVWARFHPVDQFLEKKLTGSSIFDFLELTKDFDKKKFKRYQGYLRAFEALEVRLTDRELTREQEKYMEERNRGRKRF